jgi:hypothetical protein
MRLNSSAFFAVGHIDAHLLYGNAGPTVLLVDVYQEMYRKFLVFLMRFYVLDRNYMSTLTRLFVDNYLTALARL